MPQFDPEFVALFEASSLPLRSSPLPSSLCNTASVPPFSAAFHKFVRETTLLHRWAGDEDGGGDGGGGDLNQISIVLFANSTVVEVVEWVIVVGVVESVIVVEVVEWVIVIRVVEWVLLLQDFVFAFSLFANSIIALQELDICSNSLH